MNCSRRRPATLADTSRIWAFSSSTAPCSWPTGSSPRATPRSLSLPCPRRCSARLRRSSRPARAVEDPGAGRSRGRRCFSTSGRGSYPTRDTCSSFVARGRWSIRCFTATRRPFAITPPLRSTSGRTTTARSSILPAAILRPRSSARRRRSSPTPSSCSTRSRRSLA